MKILIADDEPLARARLAALLQDCVAVEVVGEAGNGYETLQAAATLVPDLVLLDIRMPDLDGLEVARHLSALEKPPAIIFCTAYDEHALAAFEAHAIDYLLKPIRLERLQAALERARRFSATQTPTTAPAVVAGITRTHICARVRGNLVLVPVIDIDYLLAEDKYVLVRHRHGEVLIEEALKNMEDEFIERFVRIHRNCLVARDRMAGMTRAGDGRIFVQVIGQETPLEVSRRNLPGLRKFVRTL
jgi:two-component system response regulator AlgR